jgi:hypothetical protein
MKGIATRDGCIINSNTTKTTPWQWIQAMKSSINLQMSLSIILLYIHAAAFG